MADSTDPDIPRVTSARRALIAARIHETTGMPILYCAGYADACATVVETGWPTAGRSLLDTTARALLDGLPPKPDELSLSRLARSFSGSVATLDVLPAWATLGIRLGDEHIYAHPVLGLESPAVSVEAYQVDDGPLVVLVEVGSSGVPTALSSAQARQLSTALTDAADLIDTAAS